MSDRITWGTVWTCCSRDSETVSMDAVSLVRQKSIVWPLAWVQRGSCLSHRGQEVKKEKGPGTRRSQRPIPSHLLPLARSYTLETSTLPNGTANWAPMLLHMSLWEIYCIQTPSGKPRLCVGCLVSKSRQSCFWKGERLSAERGNICAKALNLTLQSQFVACQRLH